MPTDDTLTVRPSTPSDLPDLARMNQALIADEHSRNPLSLDQLAERMAGWLSGGPGGWQARLFELDGALAGYALFTPRADDYFPEQPVIYLRQFYIERARRRRGLGRQAFALLARTHFPPGCRVDIDVLATNLGGQKFWAALAFESYSTRMHYHVGD